MWRWWSELEVALTVVVGVLVGLVSALFGIGGGLLMVPFMVLALGFDQHLAQGTSLAVIIPTAVAGAFAHHKRGFVELRTAAFLAVGGVLGVYAGSKAALAIQGETLRVFFAVVLVLMGVRLIVKGARSSHERAG